MQALRQRLAADSTRHGEQQAVQEWRPGRCTHRMDDRQRVTDTAVAVELALRAP